MPQYILKNVSETAVIQLTQFFIANNQALPHILLLDGEVGTGKSFLTRSYINATNKDILVSSPTYTLVNEYQTTIGKINHFDLYRITTDDYDWIYEYLEQEDAFFIFEWAGLHPELFEEYQNIQILIEYNNTGTRDYKISLDEQYKKIWEAFLDAEGFIFEKCSNTTGA